jgi:predicted transcriptional regulator
LKRILFVMDEASSILTAAGGGSGEIASRLAQLAWRGRKFGLSTVFGAQEFTKQLIGAAREQTNLTLAFRVRPSAAQMARIVGCEGAERIPAGIPGRAILDQVGPLQVYYVPKSRLLAEHTSLIADSLTDLERQLFARSLNETDGRLPLGRIREWGNIPMHQARKLQECWALRGWIVKSAGQDNSFCLTAKARDLLANRQTPQTRADPARTAANPIIDKEK